MAVKAYLLIKLEVEKPRGVVEAVRRLGGVKSADFVCGPYDLVGVIEVADLDAVRSVVKQIQSIVGVDQISTLIAEPEVGFEFDLWELLKSYGFTEIQRNKKVSGYEWDIWARDPKTRRHVIIEVREKAPVLTSTIWTLSTAKNTVDRKGFYIAFSPKGTFDDVREYAEKSGIPVFSSIDEVKQGIESFIHLGET